MRSLPTRGPGRHALIARPAPATTRPTVGAARVAALVALALGAGSFAACAVAVGGGEDAASAAAALVVPTEPPDTVATAREVPSRSEARTPVQRVVSLSVDGGTREVSTAAETVAGVLEDAGVAVGADDVVEPALTEPAGDAVRIARVTFADGVDRQETPFPSTERADPSLDRGVRRVETAGVHGVQTIVFRARIVDGHEVSREEVLRTVVAPVAEVVRVGTKVPPPPPPPPAPARASSSSRSASSSAGPSISGDPRSIGRTLAAARGWSGSQFTCLDRLWTKESNWNPHAQNRSSGAYGIPQALPGSKMGTVASDWRTNPATQITWGLNYIAGRYGTPCGAWSHSQAVNWY